MAAKIKTLILTAGWPDRESERCDLYRVEQVTDSLEPAVHALLKPADAQSYCASRDWKVTIKPFPKGKES